MEIDRSILEHALGLPKVGQLGFIVHDVRSSLPAYASLYNLKTWFEPLYAEKKFNIGGEPRELDLNIVLAFSGKVQIELLEEKSKRAPIYKEHLDTFGEGLHHLGFYVNDLKDRLKIAEQIGLSIIQEGNFVTAGGGNAQFAYLDTRHLCGILIELIHVTLYGINVPQTEFMMNLAKLTGDVKNFTV